MTYVILQKPLPGVRPEVFFFDNREEADAFTAAVHEIYATDLPVTVTGEAGDASDVFPDWLDGLGVQLHEVHA